MNADFPLFEKQPVGSTQRYTVTEITRLVNAMGRNQITEALLHFESRTQLDFSPAYLANLSLDNLRHLLWTAILCLSPAA